VKRGAAIAGTATSGRPKAGRAKRGLTLLEVIISVALIAVVLAFMFTFYWQTMEIRRQAGLRSRQTQLARQVLSTIQSEIRGCLGAEKINFPAVQGEQRLVGTRRELTFLTNAMPADHQYNLPRESEEPPPAQHDVRLVGYSLWVDPQNKTEEGEPMVGGIIRTEKKTLNQFLVEEDDPLDIRKDLWSPELAYLEFRYYDGVEWDTKWELSDTNQNSLPQMIQVTVGYRPISAAELDDADLDEFPISDYPFGDDRARDDRYSVIVRIPAADKLFGSRVTRVGKQLSDQLGVEGQGLP
jgi:prepilin-type N-terminal cleavage/methylation domain-containing protein